MNAGELESARDGICPWLMMVKLPILMDVIVWDVLLFLRFALVVLEEIGREVEVIPCLHQYVYYCLLVLLLEEDIIFVFGLVDVPLSLVEWKNFLVLCTRIRLSLALFLAFSSP